jgi:hypothetical protein
MESIDNVIKNVQENIDSAEEFPEVMEIFSFEFFIEVKGVFRIMRWMNLSSQPYC